jgi:hypothetical protein
MFWSSDDGRDGFGCFRKDGIGVNAIQADVGGDVKTRHLSFWDCVGGYKEIRVKCSVATGAPILA